MPSVLKDKKVQIGVAGAAAVGLFVLVKRKSAGGADASQDGTGTTPQTLNTGTLDSSGTDVYNAISSLGQGWENDIREYSSGLADLSTQVATNTTSLATQNTTLAGLSTAVGKLGTIKAPATTTYHTVKITGKGNAANVTKIASYYGVKSASLLALPQNQKLKALSGSKLIGQILYVPSTLKPAKK